MSAVHSIPAPGYRIRRRPAPQSAASLFPICPDATNTNAMVGELAPLANPSNGSHRSAAGCPPHRGSDADLAGGPAHAGKPEYQATTAAAPLVGIARLAAI